MEAARMNLKDIAKEIVAQASELHLRYENDVSKNCLGSFSFFKKETFFELLMC